MPLDANQRDALPDSDFAVPETRDLPIHDKTHVSMAWRVVDNVKNISAAQRDAARRHILRKAHEFGIDTKRWNLQSMAFSAMALDFPAQSDDHPNKVPFTGVLTRLDVPSDKPLMGTGGKCVVLPTEVAEDALHSLLGMGIDFTPAFDGHRPRVKIGLITAAEVRGNAVEISGFFYAADFPEEVQQIQADKEKMGFSFEAQSLMQSMKADPLVVVACEFTGAAVLYKDKAAYYDTSIAANADQEPEMTKEEKDQLDALTKGMTDMAASVAGIAASAAKAATDAVDAAMKAYKPVAASILPAVQAHAAALRTCASNMAKDNIGLHATRGHVGLLNAMADGLEAEASMNRLPHVFNDHNWLMGSAAVPNATEIAASATKAATDAVTTLLKPVLDSVAAMGTKLADITAKLTAAPAGDAAAIAAAAVSAAAARKTLPDSVLVSLKRIGLEASADGGAAVKITVAAFDAAASKAELPAQQRTALKLALKEAGQLVTA